MIKSIEFSNFKVLRNTTLPLSQFTLLIGPNGSGKSTALQALQAAGDPQGTALQFLSAGLPSNEKVEVGIHWAGRFEGVTTRSSWSASGPVGPQHTRPGGGAFDHLALNDALRPVSIYKLNPNAIKAPVRLMPGAQLGWDGTNLAGALDQLRDQDPEQFELFNRELQRWIPDFKQVLFDTPGEGQRRVKLRTIDGHHILANDLSDGTLLALAILTVAYVPNPRPIICFEEPDRGLHPRLLRDVKDALYNLTHVDSDLKPRHPVQVIATTHSPYLLDLFKDNPEDIVIAERVGPWAKFERLSDRPDVDEILEDVSLGEAWYSGVLGGIPTKR